MASKGKKLEYMPMYLRGLSNNRWGGHKSNRMRGFRGSTYGAASEVRHIQITPELVVALENRNSGNE